MKTLGEFQSSIQILLTDIDDTLTDEGQLGPEAYSALWELSRTGIAVVPITGRPAGWCELIARQWPVAGIVGENGGFYFRYHNRQMKRFFFASESEQQKNRIALRKIETEVLQQVPGSALASDQFCRMMDLAIDFCEDVPALSKESVQKIVDIFHKHGAQAKVSSIHVNGWFGTYDKLSMTLQFLEKEFAINADTAKKVCAFSGDSPNDEPMFQYFPHSFAVANFKAFADQVRHHPQFISSKSGGQGFVEIADTLLKNKK